GAGPLSGIVAIAAGDTHSLAIDGQGNVWAWGDNSDGQLGDGSFTNRALPVHVQGPGGSGVLSGIVGIAGGSAHSIALKSDGTVWAWGLDVSGQLGTGTTTSSAPLGIATPVETKDASGAQALTGIAAVSAGNSHSMALNRSAVPAVFAWGLNGEGRVG